MEIKHTVDYEDGELILMEGGESDRKIYVLLEGQARVTKETDKGQVALALLEEGEIDQLSDKVGWQFTTAEGIPFAELVSLKAATLSAKAGTVLPVQVC